MKENLKYVLLATILFFFAACKEKKQESSNVSEKSGGNISIEVAFAPKTFFPPSINDEVSRNVINQTHIGLFRYNPHNLTLENGICTHWELDNTNTVYIFFLDSTVYFHDNECFPDGKGRRVTAQDFKYTFTYLATNTTDNNNFVTTVSRIKGAKEHFALPVDEAKNHEISGIEVIDDFTLKITLEKPSIVFRYNMAKPAASVIPYEAVEKYGANSTVGAGAYSVVKQSDQSVCVLTKNAKFFKKDEEGKDTPYLDTIVFKVVNNEKERITLFQNQELDALLFVESESVPALLDSFHDSLPYTLSKSLNSADVQNKFYNIIARDVNNLSTNNMRLLDFTKVYRKD